MDDKRLQEITFVLDTIGALWKRAPERRLGELLIAAVGHAKMEAVTDRDLLTAANSGGQWSGKILDTSCQDCVALRRRVADLESERVDASMLRAQLVRAEWDAKQSRDERDAATSELTHVREILARRTLTAAASGDE